MKEGMTRRQWEKIERVLDPCPFCGQRVRLIRSDGGDCRMSRECRHGFYIQCLACDLLFGYEPNRGGVYPMDHMNELVMAWSGREVKVQIATCEPEPRRQKYKRSHLNARAIEAREAAGLTQGQVAETLGLTLQTVLAYEKGYRRPKDDDILIMADLYGVDPDSIKEAKE